MVRCLLSVHYDFGNNIHPVLPVCLACLAHLGTCIRLLLLTRAASARSKARSLSDLGGICMQALTGECWSSKRQKSVSGKSGGSASEQRRYPTFLQHPICPTSRVPPWRVSFCCEGACNCQIRITQQDTVETYLTSLLGYMHICRKHSLTSEDYIAKLYAAHGLCTMLRAQLVGPEQVAWHAEGSQGGG